MGHQGKPGYRHYLLLSASPPMTVLGRCGQEATPTFGKSLSSLTWLPPVATGLQEHRRLHHHACISCKPSPVQGGHLGLELLSQGTSHTEGLESWIASSCARSREVGGRDWQEQTGKGCALPVAGLERGRFLGEGRCLQAHPQQLGEDET